MNKAIYSVTITNEKNPITTGHSPGINYGNVNAQSVPVVSTGNYSAGAISSSNSTIVPGTHTTPVNISAQSIGNYATSLNALPGVQMNHRQSVLITGGKQTKIAIQYVVVMSDDSCLELIEQQMITPREMIGLCKFIGTAQTVITSAIASYNLSISWTELISELGIDRHFLIAGDNYEDYDQDSEVLYIFLFDPEDTTP